MTPRRSPLVIGALILAGVVILWAVFVMARPSIPAPQPLATPIVAGAPVATVKPTDTPAVVATPTPVLAAVTTEPAALASNPTTTTRPLPVTPQALDVQLAATPSPTPYGWWDMTNQVDAALDAEVRAAYNHYWQARVDAAFTLDPSLLPQVEANPWLSGEVQALNDLRAAGTAHKVEANHALRVRYATDAEALVLDDYTLHVEDVDADTKETLSDAGSTSYHTVTRMEKIDGAWKVVDEVQVTRS
jgi:hypothetical protein